MELHAERTARFVLDPLARPVVQVHVRRAHAGGQTLEIDREAMVLRRDLDLARREIFDRMIEPAMAELELERRRAERETEKLMAEADAEDGLFPEQSAHGVDALPHRGRIAGPVRQKHSVRFVR